ncbi:MAG: hypothetical protein WAW13_01405 [Minisyncoccia bacterium]
MVYIDTCTRDDYNKAIAFLNRNNIPIVSQDEIQMVVSADLTPTMLDRMDDECDFEDHVWTGAEPVLG